MRIKILFLTNDLGLGGVQRLVVEFANYFDKEKFEVVVGTLFAGKDAFFYKDRLSSEVRFENFGFKSYLDLFSWFRFYRFLKKEKFGIVFTQLFLADFVGRIAAWFAGVPVIVAEIQNIIPDLPKKYIFIDRILRRITDACISPTEAITKYAMEIVGFPREKIFEVPTNAVDEKRFKIGVDRGKIKKSLGLPAASRIVINVGRLVEQKGQSVLIKAAKKILGKEPHAYFLIAGSGKLEKELQKEIDSLGIADHFKLLGDRKDIPELLMSSDVFAFPSIWEGQGLILFEAFFSKIPIVASDTGGIPDVIKNEETGLLVPPGNPDALADAILRVLSDKPLAEKMAKTAYERFQDRTMVNSVKKLQEVFQVLVDRKIKKS